MERIDGCVDKSNENAFIGTFGFAVFVAISVLMLTGCSETGDNRSPQQSSPIADGVVLGGAVKGPLKDAVVTAYQFDFSATDLKGELVATGSTNDNGEIRDLVIAGENVARAPFLVEFTEGVEWNGLVPAIPTLRTVVSGSDINTARPVYATPLTTLVIELARLSADLTDSTTAMATFQRELMTQQQAVKRYFGLELIDSIDLFHRAPLVSSSSNVDTSTVAYRTVIEVLGALIHGLHVINTDTSVSADQLFAAVAKDLIDGDIDGKAEGENIAVLSGISVEALQDTLTLPPGSLLQLDVPGSDAVIAQINQLLVEEASRINRVIDLLPLPTLGRLVPGNDSDGDKFVDVIDKFPNDASEWADVDNDNVGDNSDACLQPGAGHTDNDGDGVCDDVDAIPRDLYPNDAGRSSLNDNTSPVASIAQTPTSVFTDTPVVVDGRESSDEEGDPLSYAWSLVGPSASSAMLRDALAPVASFTPDVEGRYTVTLVVSDLEDSAPVSAIIEAIDAVINVPPVANAGVNQAVNVGDLVMLDGSASSDANGDTLTYWWVVTSPGSSTVVLSDPTAVMPTFTAVVEGQYQVALTVNDGVSNSAISNITVTATELNIAPVANAGVDQDVDYVIGGVEVILDGTGSSDANGDTLTYRWELLSKPDGGDTSGDTANIRNANSATAAFTVVLSANNQIGEYIFRLTVSDGNESATDTVTYNIQKPWLSASTLFGSALMALALLMIPAQYRKNTQHKKQ